jgi:HAD superfamily hydrolase (TIGR01509 family)
MTRAAKTRAVVFDLDGTLLDSLSLVLRAIAHAIEPFGPVPPTMEIFSQLGGPPERFLPALVGDERHVPVAMARMEAFHQTHQHLIRPFDGAGALLEQLRAREVALGIWTGRDRASGDALLRAHRLHEHFATVVYGDDLPTHKPDPQGLREILARLGVAANETIFVGDADVDVLGGEACGVGTVLIRHAREVDESLRAKTWRTVTSPHEAYELLLGCVK